MPADLPEDVHTQILRPLPAKSLLRFWSISKSWNSLITSLWFIALHQSRSVEAREDLILLMSYFLKRPLLIKTVRHDDGESLTEARQLEFPIKTDKDYIFVDTCNGLLCLFEYNVKHVIIILRNPYIRTCFKVPSPRFIDVPHSFGVGFGFDSWNGQYKVLRFIYAITEIYQFHIPPEVEVFVLGTDRWRRIDIHVPVVICSLQAFLNGAIHWIAYGLNRSRVILAFDVHKEVFREIEVPSSMLYRNKKRLSVTANADSLCLLEDDPWTGESKVLSIWVMKRYGVKESWSKQYSIDVRDQEGINMRMLGFRKHNKILFVNKDKELVTYDPKSGRIELLGIQGLALGKPLKAIPSMESLVLLKGADGL